MNIRLLAGISSLLLFSGCAIHPVPEDVTGVNTYHIVRQIRCETRTAVIDFLLQQLHQHADNAGDPIARKILERYQSNPESINSFTPALFPGPEYVEYRHFYNVIYSAAIGYTFDLTMTEQNDLGTNINLLGPWKSKFTLGISGDFNRLRTNQRTFTVTDTFAFLLANLNRLDEKGIPYCDGQIRQANYIYPIAGQIGVYKTVRTFFELTVLGGLSAKTSGPGEKGPPSMVDNLKFTTTVDLMGTPKVVFTPVGAALQVTDASVTGLAKRTDAHQVTVGLAVMPSGAADAGLLQGFLFPGANLGQRGLRPRGRAAAEGSLFVGNRITGTARTQAERAVLNAIDQVKSKEIQLIAAP
jgi:hypothetical protein